jgi:hypothetical protein
MLDEIYDTIETHSWNILLLFGAGLVSEQVVCNIQGHLRSECEAKYGRIMAEKKPISIFRRHRAIADAHSVPTHQSDLNLEL